MILTVIRYMYIYNDLSCIYGIVDDVVILMVVPLDACSCQVGFQ